MAYGMGKRAGLLMAAIWLVGLPWLLPGEPAIRYGLTVLAVIATLWLTEAIHVSLTALLVPLLVAAFGLMPLGKALGAFAHPVIFLFLGGFALAAALHTQQLDRYLATRVIQLAGGRPLRAILLLFLATAVLSMWISNTATVAIMLPLALGLLRRPEANVSQGTSIFVLLGIAYSGSLGGLGTLVGSPPNAIAAAYAGIQFKDWLLHGLPMMLLLWPLMLGVLYLLLRPDFSGLSFPTDEPDDSGRWRWTRARQLTLLIFAVTVTGWMGSGQWGPWLGIDQMDSWVALLAIALLGLTRVAGWKEIEQQTEWGVLLLFGGGLCLSGMLQASGCSTFLAGLVLDWLQGMPVWLTLLAITCFVVFLSEMTSNTATAALMIPLLVPLAGPLGIHPMAMAALIAIAASCAFMLPVATPPNALVFATGMVPQRRMMRCGVVLDLACGSLLATAIALFG